MSETSRQELLSAHIVTTTETIAINIVLLLLTLSGALACASTDPAAVDNCISQLTTCKTAAGNDNATATCQCNEAFYPCVSSMGSANAKECANFVAQWSNVSQSCSDLQCTRCPSGSNFTYAIDPSCTAAEANAISSCMTYHSRCLADETLEDCVCYFSYDNCLSSGMPSDSAPCVTFKQERDKSKAVCEAASCTLCAIDIPSSDCPLPKLLAVNNCTEPMTECMREIQKKPDWSPFELCPCYEPTTVCLTAGEFHLETCNTIKNIVESLDLSCKLTSCKCARLSGANTPGSTSAADRTIVSVATIISTVALLLN